MLAANIAFSSTIFMADIASIFRDAPPNIETVSLSLVIQSEGTHLALINFH
jgi:hypothetical protein